jgi:hypothetical protein
MACLVALHPLLARECSEGVEALLVHSSHLRWGHCYDDDYDDYEK